MVKTVLRGLILLSISASTCWGDNLPPTVPALIATPPQPAWTDLTPKQQATLTPLADDWDSMEPHRRKKWIDIASRFEHLSTTEQVRIRDQMQAWGRLTPIQRQIARENFKAARELSPAQKEALKKKWEEYSQLSDAEKHRLAVEAAAEPQTNAKRPAGAFPPPPVLQEQREIALPKSPQTDTQLNHRLRRSPIID